MTNKALRNLHIDIGHGSFADLTSECIRLEDMTRKIGLRISATVQECNSCANRGRNFKTGKTEETVGFNINVLVKYRKVRNLRKFNHLISIRDIHTGLTMAKLAKFRDSTRTFNRIVKKVWVHGEHGEGFCRPQDSCVRPLLE